MRPRYLRVLLFDELGEGRWFLRQSLKEFAERAFDGAAVAKKGTKPAALRA